MTKTDIVTNQDLMQKLKKKHISLFMILEQMSLEKILKIIKNI